MDDGYGYQHGHNRAYRFSTHSFHPNPVRVYFSAYPLEDRSRLVYTLRDHFEGLMAATIQKHYSYYTLYIRSSSTERFVYLIRPYIHPCFDSKIQ